MSSSLAASGSDDAEVHHSVHADRHIVTGHPFLRGNVDGDHAKSTLTMRSTVGVSRTIPRPLARSSLPSRKIMPPCVLKRHKPLQLAAKQEHNHNDDNNEPQPTAAPVDVRAMGENRRKSICESSKHDRTPQTSIPHVNPPEADKTLGYRTGRRSSLRLSKHLLIPAFGFVDGLLSDNRRFVHNLPGGLLCLPDALFGG